ncbi:MAG: hypothetical protein WCC69_09420 [Pirellulales bacterium]
MIRTFAWMACAATAFIVHTPVVLTAESTFDGSTLDSPLGQPIFGSPESVSEAERSLAPQVHRVPLNEAIGTTLSRRDDVRSTPVASSNRTTWERRAFATAALVALVCVALGVLAALMTLAQRR